MTDKQEALISVIKWYRDEYHRCDFGHNEMIENIKKTTDDDLLSLYEKIVDGWLDY